MVSVASGPSADLRRTLQTTFGFDRFREGQEPVIRALLAGRSALAVFPTGSGKSLCYQLTALHLPGLTLVVSPLIALMKDQVDALRRRGIPAARLDSSLGAEEIRDLDARLRDGSLKLLYVAPERFSNEGFLQKLRRLTVSLMVIDEAHCISEWGHNFRPDYLKLARAAHDLGVPAVLALTATATPEVAADICRSFKIAPGDHVHTGFYRPNLHLRAQPVRAADRLAALTRRLRETPRGSTIVYVTLQATAETVAAALAAAGLPARAYHAGMDGEERAAVQEWFMGTEAGIVVATIAFGMGIDKADIRLVCHYNLPKSLENYSQEIGRAGRDGEPARCESFGDFSDAATLLNFTFGDTPDPAAAGALVAAILAQPAQFDVSPYDLSQEYDLRPLVVGTLLTYLELAGVMEATAPFYSAYQIEILRPLGEIVGQFDGERAAFVRDLLGMATKAKRWHHLDLAAAVERLPAPRERIVRALGYLEERGDLRLQVTGFRQGYRRGAATPDPARLQADVVARFEKRERQDVERMEKVLELFGGEGCLVRRLLQHFGEELARDCGHCGRCAGERPTPLAGERVQVALPPARALDELRRAHPKALGTPRQFARFLCGITSPRTSQAKLGRHALFGSLGDAPFPSVLEALSSARG